MHQRDLKQKASCLRKTSPAVRTATHCAAAQPRRPRPAGYGNRCAIR